MSFYFEFRRTECACRECVACCKRQPGPLAPGDLEKIAAYLGETPEEARRHFRASPGAIVKDSRSGQKFQIGTITPKMEGGRCVFLDAQDRCRIHAVAPAGCAYFDTHMKAPEAHRRSLGLVQLQQSFEYQRLRANL